MTSTQIIYLNQTEYKVPPVIHAVQNDTGRKVKMVIQDQVLPSGSTATLDFMRSDKSHYSVTCEAFVSADNSFTTEIDQALTQAGQTECQLKVSGIVSTFTFIIDVQPDVSGISVQQDGYSVEQIIEIMGTKGITEDIKQTLLACFAKVAWIDDQGQDYYDALHDALYPPRPILSITATYIQSGTVYAGDSLDSLRSDLSVQANYEDGGSEFVTDYYLSGTLYEGESTITVTYGGKTTTFDVQVVTLVSISAVYTQSGTVYDTDSLDSLRDDLVVTAIYDDSSTAVVPSTDYTLSGTLTAGTSTIMVSYSGKTTTFTVTVSTEWDANPTLLYNAKVGDTLSENTTMFTTSGGTNVTQVMGSDYCRITSPNSASTTNLVLNLTDATATKCKIMAKVRFISIATNDSSGVGVRVQVSNGTNGSSILERHDRFDGKDYFVLYIGQTTQNVELIRDHWYTIELERTDTGQIVTVDGVRVLNDTYSTYYCSKNAIFVMATNSSVQGAEDTVVDVSWVAYYNKD